MLNNIDKKCLNCDISIANKRSDAKFCSTNCRDRYTTAHKKNPYIVTDKPKRCVQCGIEKPEYEFYKRSRGTTLRLDCKKCVNQRTNEWRIRNPERTRQTQEKLRSLHPERSRKYQLKHVYGITPEEYDEMLKRQNSCCAICHKEEKLHIDHCHKTNTIRGLLCGHCNRMIGCAFENEQTLLRAAEYVSKWSNVKTNSNVA